MVTEPLKKDEYCKELSGDWGQVPEWAIKRLNFLEERVEEGYKRLAPLMDKICPDDGEHSCLIVRHCFPGMCRGGCGKTNEIFMNKEEIDYMSNLPQEIKDDLWHKTIQRHIKEG